MTLPLRVPRLLPLLAATTITVAAATPALAQFGGLRRAVERRVEQKAGQTAEDRVTKATLIPPTFDNTTVELTPERLDRYIAAMEKRKAALASNRQQYERMRDEASALREQAQRAENRGERESYEKATDQYRSCRSAFRQSMEADAERQTQALQQRMMANPVAAQNDPKMKELAAVMQSLAAAQQSGDTAAVRRATERMGNAFGITIDSAALDRRAAAKCGMRPAKPRSVATADSLNAKADDLNKAANALLGLSSGVKGSEVGLTDAQAQMIWERIQSWLNGVQENAVITRTFTKLEYDELLKRRGQLRKAFSNSE